MAVVGEQHYSNFQASPIETRNALKDALDKVCIAPVSPTGSNNVSADNRADVKQALQQWLDQAPSWKTGYALLYTLQCRSKTSEDFDDSPEGIDDLANGIYDVHENSVQRAKLLHELGKELGFRTYLAHALSRRVRHRREHESLGLFNENSRRRITKEGISNGSLESSDEKTHEVKNIYTFEGKRILAYFTVRWRDCVQRFEPKGYVSSSIRSP
jgi:hypothetical protein